MRLSRRRRRSLHDLDINYTTATPSRQRLPGTGETAFDWVTSLLTDRERTERAERRHGHRQAREANARDAMESATVPFALAADPQPRTPSAPDYIPRGGSHRPRRRTQSQPDWPDMDGVHHATTPRRIVGRHQDILQLNERIRVSTLRRHRDPQEALAIVEARLTQRMQQHIEYQWPGSTREWEYAFDIAQDVVNQETNITLTARRP